MAAAGISGSDSDMVSMITFPQQLFDSLNNLCRCLCLIPYEARKAAV